MNIEQIHKLINFYVGKETDSWFSPQEIDQSLDAAQMIRFNTCYERYALDQKAQDDLGPFKTAYTFTNGTSPAGVITIPATYIHFLGGWAQSFDNRLNSIVYNPIEIVNDDELALAISSQLCPISVTKPIGQWKGKGVIQLWPQLPNAGYISYLRRPLAPVFNYTKTGRVVTYLPSGSQNIEFDDANTHLIIMRALQILGISVQSESILEYSMSKEQKEK